MKISERREKINRIENINLRYVCVVDRKRRDQRGLLKKCDLKYKLGRTRFKNPSLVSLNLKVLLLQPNRNSGVLEAELKPREGFFSLTHSLGNSGIIGFKSQNPGTVLFNGSKAGSICCEFTLSTRKLAIQQRWSSKPEKVNWKFRFFKQSVDGFLRLIEIRKQDKFNQTPMIAGIYGNQVAILSIQNRKVVRRGYYHELNSFLSRRMFSENETQTKVILLQGRVLVVTLKQRCFNAENTETDIGTFLSVGKFRNNLKLSFIWGSTKVDGVTTEILRGSQYSYLKYLELFEVAAKKDLVLIILRGKLRFSCFVFQLNNFMNSECEDGILPGVSLVHKFESGPQDKGMIHGGFFLTRDLICLPIGRELILWSLICKERKVLRKVRMSGLGFGCNFRRARFVRADKRVWYESGKISGVFLQSLEIKERGYVDLEGEFENINLLCNLSEQGIELGQISMNDDESLLTTR